MFPLKIRLLGGFSVEIDNQPVTKFRSTKSRALLVYLASSPERDHLRSTLATLFWGDYPEKSAKTNLRIELSNLKKLLGNHPALEVSRQAVRLDKGSIEVDTGIFLEGIDAFWALPAELQLERVSQLNQLTELYQGDFLHGFDSVESHEFEQWRVAHQEKIHQRAMEALSLLQMLYVQTSRWSDVARVARKQLSLVNWVESAHRCLIQAMIAQGDLKGATKQYESCCTILLEELGKEPSAETQALLGQLKEPPKSLAKKDNLTLTNDLFVGRKKELETLAEFVPKYRMVTLLGLGGVGKSHLAQTVGLALRDRFKDGVWFVPLANIDPTAAAGDLIALAIGGALGHQLTDKDNLLQELASYLASKQILLILDNWEHLLESADSVIETLLQPAEVHILATSRAKLNSGGERVVQLSGLPDDDALSLFMEQAELLVPSFSAIGEQAKILDLCHLVDGLPLGIKIAAGWVGHFEISEIMRSILEIEAEPRHAERMVERHHKIGLVFEFSWRLLNERERLILAKASVFKGGFDRAAADAVLGASLGDLTMLMNQSLVGRVKSGRYDLHPLLQEYLSTKLAEFGSEQATTRDVHRVHYFERLLVSESAEFEKNLSPEFANLRRAWLSAIEQNALSQIEKIAPKFGQLIDQLGVYRDGAELYRLMEEQISEQAGSPELRSNLLSFLAKCVRFLDGHIAARPIYKRVVVFGLEDSIAIDAHIWLGNGYAEEGNWKETDFHLFSAERIAYQLEEPKQIATAVESRIFYNMLHFRGDFDAYLNDLDQLLVMLEPVEDASFERRMVKESRYMVAVRYRLYESAYDDAKEALAYWKADGRKEKLIHAQGQMSLIEQFIGLLQESAENAKLALEAEREEDVELYTGLLRSNLCLILRQLGEYEEALAYGHEMINHLHSADKGRIEGMTWNRIGHVCVEMERWPDAIGAYRQAIEIWNTMPHPNRYEALAGLALAFCHKGQKADAIKIVEETLAYIKEDGLRGFVEPAFLLKCCAKVFELCDRPDEAYAVWEQANDWIEWVASRMDDERLREAFLNNRPDNLDVRQALLAKM